MDTISFEEFYTKYGVRRNPVESISNYDNTMLDSNEEELNIVEEEDPTKVWTLTSKKDEQFVLNPGLIYKRNVIGYFICNKEWEHNQKTYILL